MKLRQQLVEKSELLLKKMTLEAKSPTNRTSPRLRKQATCRELAKQSAEKLRKGQIGTDQQLPNVIDRRLRTALLPRSHQKCCATTLSSAVSTPTIPSRCCSRRRPSVRWRSRPRAASTPARSSQSPRRRATAIRPTRATCPTCIRTLPSEHANAALITYFRREHDLRKRSLSFLRALSRLII